MSIEVEKLCFSYGRREVLRDVSFTARPGELTLVLGPNGVGKSTLFRCILGLLQDWKGSIRVEGADVRTLRVRELARRVAYIPQSHYPTFNYSAFDMVLMGTTRRTSPFVSPGKKEREAAMEAMEAAGAAYLRDRSYHRLSGGEQQLVLIARALAQDTRVLLMDEPAANLDYGNQLRLMEQVRALAERGYLILLNSHNPQHALDYAHRVLAIRDGRTRAFGKPGEVLTPELIRELYGVEVDFLRLEGRCLLSPVRGGAR